MKNISVISGISSQDLAKKVARKLGAKLVSVDHKMFPDGESKITFKSDIRSKTCVIVQSTHPPVDSHMMQALAMAHKAREAADVIMVIPYLGYARQDKEFLKGEIVTSKVIAKLFKSVGVSRLIVVDIHSKTALAHFKGKKVNISAVPVLVKYARRERLKDPLVVSPDLGGTDRAKKFAELMKTDYISLNKKRDRKTGRVNIEDSELDVKKRDLVIVDDMISSGGSIIKATEFLKRKKCGRIIVCCTHALLIGEAEKKILRSGVEKVISANTIPGKTSVADVSGIIADELSNA